MPSSVRQTRSVPFPLLLSRSSTKHTRSTLRACGGSVRRRVLVLIRALRLTVDPGMLRGRWTTTISRVCCRRSLTPASSGITSSTRPTMTCSTTVTSQAIGISNLKGSGPRTRSRSRRAPTLRSNPTTYRRQGINGRRRDALLALSEALHWAQCARMALPMGSVR
jgi:hypothetical protein